MKTCEEFVINDLISIRGKNELLERQIDTLKQELERKKKNEEALKKIMIKKMHLGITEDDYLSISVISKKWYPEEYEFMVDFFGLEKED